MAQSSFRPVFVSDSASPPPAKFCYPPRTPYGVRLNTVRPVRRRRSWHRSTDLYMILFPLLCFVLLFIGSLWVMLSFYAPENVDFGRNVSHLFKANSLFVRRIKITNELRNQGLVIYGLPKIPALDKQVTWAEAHDVTVLNGGLQEWDFWLNVGSEVTVQYNSSDTTQELIFVVVEGEEKMQKWLKNPNNIDMVSSWQAVQGTGDIQYRVQMDQKYLFSFLNPNSENAEVSVNITIRGTLHGTDDYKSKCTSTTCEVCLDFLGSDVLLLTTETFQVIEHRNSVIPSRLLQQDSYFWSVNVTFEQRWVTYMAFWGAMGLIMLIMYIFCRPSSQEIEASRRNPEPSFEGPTIPVVFEEDNNVSKSLQSEALPVVSADLDLQDPEAVEDFMCIICFDQRRNCFFDPCGHCATCYSCSMKILKDKKATCPLCRQQVRVVRKLFLR